MSTTPAEPSRDMHKDEAERLIQYAGKTGSESAASSAVAHATLHLAEQQRIANLIAWQSTLVTAWLAEGGEPIPRIDELGKMIRRGLGL